VSLRVKFLALSVGGVALLIGLVLVVSGRWAQEELEAAAFSRGEILARGLARATAEQAVVGNYTQTRSILERSTMAKGVAYAIVLGDEERVMASSRDAELDLHFPVGRPPADSLTSAGLESGQMLARRTVFRGEGVLDVSALQEAYGRSWGTVRVGIRLGDVRAAVHDLRVRVALLGLIALALGAVGAALLARSVVSPIRAVVRESDRFAAGEYSARVSLERRDEIGRLASSFNEMAQAIESHIREIREKTKQITVGYQVLEQLTSTIEKEMLLQRLLDASAQTVKATRCTVLALDPRHGVVEAFELKQGSYKSEALEPAAVGLESFENVPDLPEILRRRRGLSIGPASIMAPILGAGRKLGLLYLTRASDAPFSEAENLLAQTIARHLAVALENSRLYELATRDGLTGFYIKRFFSIRLDEEVDRSRRYGSIFALLMADLDLFKLVNDERGHLTGDRVLREMGNVISEQMRASDIICRFGGEEIVLLLPEQDKETGRAVAERIRVAVEAHPFPAADGGDPVAVTISIGVAGFPDDGQDSAVLLAAADKAVYEAKAQGRNKVIVAGDD